MVITQSHIKHQYKQTLQKLSIQRSTHICFHPLNKINAPSPETCRCNFLDVITMHNCIFLFFLQFENLCNIFRETTNTSCILIKGQQSIKYFCVVLYIICGGYKKQQSHIVEWSLWDCLRLWLEKCYQRPKAKIRSQRLNIEEDLSVYLSTLSLLCCTSITDVSVLYRCLFFNIAIFFKMWTKNKLFQHFRHSCVHIYQ